MAKTPAKTAPVKKSNEQAKVGRKLGDNTTLEDLAKKEPDKVDAPDEKVDVPPVSVDPINWSLSSEGWEDSRLFVGIPSYKDSNPATMWCLLAMCRDLGKKVQFDFEMGDAMIYHARNLLAEKFLASDAEWMLMIDDDIVFPVGRPGYLKQICRLPANYPDRALGFKTAERLVNWGHKIVGATYFYRTPNSVPVNSLNRDENYLRRASSYEDRTMPCDWVGTGCILIHRDVFNDIRNSFPELEPGRPDMPFNFFHPGEDGRGEDIAFCGRAKQCGHQPHVDVGLHALHIGRMAFGVHTTSLNRLS